MSSLHNYCVITFPQDVNVDEVGDQEQQEKVGHPRASSRKALQTESKTDELVEEWRGVTEVAPCPLEENIQHLHIGVLSSLPKAVVVYCDGSYQIQSPISEWSFISVYLFKF